MTSSIRTTSSTTSSTNGRTTTCTAVALVLGAALLTACGSQGLADTPSQNEPEQADRIGRQAQQYVGDPWERRYRQQFWADQHIHDSWNRCHLGENVPKSTPKAMGC